MLFSHSALFVIKVILCRYSETLSTKSCSCKSKIYLSYVQGPFANKNNVKHKVLALLGLICYVLNTATYSQFISQVIQSVFVWKASYTITVKEIAVFNVRIIPNN